MMVMSIIPTATGLDDIFHEAFSEAFVPYARRVVSNRSHTGQTGDGALPVVLQ